MDFVTPSIPILRFEEMELIDMQDNLLKIQNLRTYFFTRRGIVKAVDGVDLEVQKGKLTALVGESGCGKTTLGRLILRLMKPTNGKVFFKGEDIYLLDIGIARALALNPEFVVCDEAVSALDVSIRAQILNLLIDLKDSFNLTLLFITHDLSVVSFLSDRIGVMYLGKCVEIGPTADIFTQPLHPYTPFLLSAVPIPDPHGRNKAKLILKG